MSINDRLLELIRDDSYAAAFQSIGQYRVALLKAARTESRQSAHDKEFLAIGKAIDRAAGELPEGWSIQIELERDAGTVTLYNPAGETVEVETGGELFSSQIGMTIEAAIESCWEQKGGAE